MATAARKVSVTASDLTGVHNVATKVVFANAAAGDITQLGSNKVLLVVDADSTAGTDRQLIVAQAEAAVYELKRQLFLKSNPSQMTTTTTTTYRPR